MSLAGYARKIKGGCLWNMKDDLCNKRDTLLVSLLRARALYLDFILPYATLVRSFFNTKLRMVA